MSERLNLPERPAQGHETGGENVHEAPKSAEHHEHHDSSKTAEKARAVIESQAVSAEKTKAAQPKDHKQKEVYVSRELKKVTYKRTMKRVRKQLSPVSRAGSAVIHQPAVDAVSEATAKTVGRASGLLGAGLVAFVGTTVYYFLARHNGDQYKFSVYLVLLAAGLVAGWLIEVAWHLLRRSK